MRQLLPQFRVCFALSGKCSKELLLDPMSERLAFGNKRAKRSMLHDYCGKARWIADAAVPEHADNWLDTIEEAAGHADREREHVGRQEWKQATKGITILAPKAPFVPTPDLIAGAGRLRPVLRIRHDHHCSRDDWPFLFCDRNRSRLRRCYGASLANLHGANRNPGSGRQVDGGDRS